MKICFVSDFYPTVNRTGGIGVYTRSAATALQVRCHAVHVLVGTREKSYDASDGDVQIHVRRVRWIPVFGKWLAGLGESISLAWALGKLHRQFRFDVVEFPNWEGTGLVTAFCGFVPVVVRLHTSMIESVNTLNRKPTISERFMIWAEKTSARRARATVTHSRYQRELLGTAYGVKATTVIPHGIRLPEALSISASTSAVLFVGSLNPRKGVDTLLAAIPRVLRSHPAAEFWIVGSDPGEKIERRFRENNPQQPPQAVLFLGSLSTADLADRYRRCAVYATASVHESFGLTLVEAMGYAKPVVACNVSAMPEIIRDGETGLLVPPNDPAAFADNIIQLLNDAGLRQQMGRAGRERAEQEYTAAKMAERLEKFFQSVSN